MPTMPSWRKALGLSGQRAGSGGSIEDFVVITGFSGAGKSQAMACFEDAGYFCVDNLPPEMILSLADLFQHEGSKVEHAAVVSDVRGGDYFEGFVKMLDDLEERGTEYRLLFLDASEEELVNRYKETRRRHPLAPGGNVGEGIRVERALLEPLRERADVAHRHHRHVGVAPASRGGGQDARAGDRGQAVDHLPHLRLQARRAARGRPLLRRALPAESALRAGAARAHRASTARWWTT